MLRSSRAEPPFYRHGSRTANGERFDPSGMTAAHPSLPFGTRVRVVHPASGNAVVVRINDRGPFTGGRVIDLAEGAARKLGIIRAASRRLRSIASIENLPRRAISRKPVKPRRARKREDGVRHREGAHQPDRDAQTVGVGHRRIDEEKTIRASSAIVIAGRQNRRAQDAHHCARWIADGRVARGEIEQMARGVYEPDIKHKGDQRRKHRERRGQ